jgi:hypothetical protein
MSWVWGWAFTILGVSGTYLAGSRKWQGWALCLLNQTLWCAYAILTKQWGFLPGVAFYTVVHTRNLVKWTR